MASASTLIGRCLYPHRLAASTLIGCCLCSHSQCLCTHWPVPLALIGHCLYIDWPLPLHSLASACADGRLMHQATLAYIPASSGQPDHVVLLQFLAEHTTYLAVMLAPLGFPVRH